MANKKIKEKHKLTRKTLRDNEFYNPNTKRYEYHYKDSLGKARALRRLQMVYDIFQYQIRKKIFIRIIYELSCRRKWNKT